MRTLLANDDGIMCPIKSGSLTDKGRKSVGDCATRLVVVLITEMGEYVAPAGTFTSSFVAVAVTTEPLTFPKYTMFSLTVPPKFVPFTVTVVPGIADAGVKEV